MLFTGFEKEYNYFTVNQMS